MERVLEQLVFVIKAVKTYNFQQVIYSRKKKKKIMKKRKKHTKKDRHKSIMFVPKRCLFHWKFSAKKWEKKIVKSCLKMLFCLIIKEKVFFELFRIFSLLFLCLLICARRAGEAGRRREKENEKRMGIYSHEWNRKI